MHIALSTAHFTSAENAEKKKYAFQILTLSLSQILYLYHADKY